MDVLYHFLVSVRSARQTLHAQAGLEAAQSSTGLPNLLILLYAYFGKCHYMNMSIRIILEPLE